MPFNDGEIVSVKHVCSCKPPNRNMSVSFNVIHFLASNKLGGGAPEQEVANAFHDALSVQYAVYMNTSSAYQGAIVQRVYPLPLGAQFASNRNPLLGALVDESLPYQVCGAITKYTANAGRKYRGRVYVPFPTEAHQGPNNEPTAAFLQILNNLALGLITQRVVGTVTQTTLTSVLFHGAAAVPVQTGLTGAAARRYWTTQRRRNNAWRGDTLPTFVVAA